MCKSYAGLWINTQGNIVRCLQNIYREKQNVRPHQSKRNSTKAHKESLDFIVLRLIEQESMYGYQVIAKTRKNFGVYFGPSTVYPLMANLEKK